MVSVDSLMREAFADQCTDGGAGLRLVHRLDKDTTGLLLVAKHADAAAWLGQAFRGSTGGGSSHGNAAANPRRSSDGGDGGSRSGSGTGSQGRGEVGPWVQKQYWAVLDCRGSASAARLPPSGVINLPVAARSGTGAAAATAAAAAASGGGGGGGAVGQGPGLLPALSRYRARAQNEGLAWLQLDPATGRKHQLRIHCAQGLGAPILGDGKYGPGRYGPTSRHAPTHLAAQHALWRELRPGLPGVEELPLFLHCRALAVCRPGERLPLQLVAPLPEPWRVLLDRMGWPLPGDSRGDG